MKKEFSCGERFRYIVDEAVVVSRKCFSKYIDNENKRNFSALVQCLSGFYRNGTLTLINLH